MSTFKKISPALCLMIICTIICGLLIVTYNLTYKDTSGIITDDLRAACEKIDGEAQFGLITDKEAAGLAGKEFKAINKIIKNLDKQTFLFEVITTGYADNGVDVVISLTEEGAVKGISVVSLAETPGVGTKINNDEFLAKFAGASENIVLVKGEPKNSNEYNGITGSTRSSEGLANAINTALNAYKALDKNAPVAETEGQQ